MRPFRPSLPNQIQPQRGNNPLLQQQGLLVNPHQNPSNFNNQPQILPPLPGLNAQFQNAHLMGLHGNLNGMPMAQNLNPALALQLQNLLQFQGQPNLLQTANIAAQLQQGGLSMGYNAVQNLNQIMGLLNGQLGSQNPMLQGNQFMPGQCPQNSMASMQVGPLNLPPSSHPLMGNANSLNSGYVGNPHWNQNSLNSTFGIPMASIGAMQCTTHDPHMTNTPNIMGQQANVGTPAANQKLLPPSSSTPMQSQWNKKNLQPNAIHHPQAKEVHRSAISGVISENSSTRNFTRNFDGFGKRESSHNRSQKPQFNHKRNAQGNLRPFTRNGGKGQQSWKQRKQQFAGTPQERFTKPVDVAPTVHRRRPLLMKYPENEVQQWREARKKNFPMKAKNENSGRGKNDEVDADVKLRRQQLKEVLAKQEELGVEVAEIPPNYLSEHEDQALRKDKKRSKVTDGRFSNKGNNKWSKHAKRPKVMKEASPVVKREPSLLQKLLSTEIKRDKSRLLQVFKFMVLNDFFDHWPDNPLVFPSVTVKGDTGYRSEIDSGRNPSTEEVNSAAIGIVKNDTIKQIDSQNNPSAADVVETGFSEDDSDNNSSDEVADQRPAEKENSVSDQFGKSEEGEITE